MSINSDDTACEGSVNPPWEMEANPAVRQVTDWKRQARIFSHTVYVPMVSGLFHSSSANSTAPPTISVPLISSTRRVCTANWRPR